MKDCNISKSEWMIMKALWENPGATLKEIAEKLKGSGWSYTTIRTLVGRLLEKGALHADKTDPGAFLYYPALTEKECKEAEAKSFLSRVFDGSVAMMMTTLAGGGNISEKEAEELKAIIEKMDGGGE